jgi:hypothetical protein
MIDDLPRLNLFRRPWWQIVSVAVSVIALFLLLARLAGNAQFSWVDYNAFYYPAGRLWLARDPGLAQALSGDYHPPWAVVLGGLLAVWGEAWGRGILLMASLTTVIVSAAVFSKPGWPRLWSTILGVANLHVFDLIYRGQIDAINVLGTMVGWLGLMRNKPLWLGAGYILLMMKPPNSIPIALFFLWLSWRRWSLRDVAISLTAPLVMVMLSFIVLPTWLMDTMQNLDTPATFAAWITTIWRVGFMLHLPAVVPWAIVLITLGISAWAWHRLSAEPDKDAAALARLMLVIATTFMITPYALSYHYVLLLAIVMPYLASWKLPAYFGLYALTFLPLVRLFIGVHNAWIDMLFVVVLYILVVICIMRRTAKHETVLLEPAPVLVP